MPAEIENVVGSVTGRQNYIIGSNVASATDDVRLDNRNRLAGVALAASSVYYYRIPTAGATLLDICLKPSNVSGTCAAQAYATLADGITQKGAATTLTAPSDTTQVVDRIEDLGGERFWMLKITTGSGGTTTFSQAEYSTN